MRRRKGAEGGGGDTAVSDELRCRRSDGRGWRCPFPARTDSSFCEKHFQQRLRYEGQKQPQATLNGRKKPQMKKPRVEEVASPCSKRKPQLKRPRVEEVASPCRKRKPQLKRPRVEEVASPCKNRRSPPVKVVDEQETQRTQPHSTTGKGKISEDKDCSSRSTTTEKETNFTATFEVDDVASHSTRQTNGKFPDQEIGRYLRKYLASGVMEIALDYDSDYDFRKVAGLELSE